MGSDPPPPSDEEKYLAKTQADTMREQLEFNKTSYAGMMELAKQQMARGDEQYAFQKQLAEASKARSDKYDALFDATTGKQIQAFSDEVDRFDTSAYRDQLGGAAVADVESGMDDARKQMNRYMSSRGINPNSGAYIATLGDMQLSGGLAKASAMTMAQQAAKREGLNLRAQSAGLGSGLSGAASGALGQAGAMGMSGLSASGTGLTAMGAATSAFNQGQGVAANWGASASSTYNNIWNQAYQASQADDGFGALLGGVAGMFTGGLGASFGSALGKKWGGP